MKKYIFKAILAGIFVVALASCSEEEEPVLEYTDPAENFMPKDSETDELSELRRQFFNSTGSYLLFNDTLQHKFIGQDPNGENIYFTELLDIKYEVGQTSTVYAPYTYTYMNKERSMEAYSYLEKFILPHFSPTLKPYSWLLVSTISSLVNNKVTHPYAVAGQRAVALACSELPKMKNDTQKQQLANRHLLVIVQNLAQKNNAKFKDFFDIGAKDYNNSYTLEDGQTANDKLRSKGFISSPKANTFPSQDDDIKSYASIIISSTEASIEKTYAKYPLVISKAKMFREILINLGYIF